ncbi:MAG: AAA family ATPase [Dethiosulfatibacter sp.]|nr:AAA family ATPase [Dethiosulfatibacter sp.]
MDVLKFVDDQLLERYKHCIIYGPPLTGKSKMAQEISKEKSGIYIDLLLEFQKNQKFKQEIDIFSAEDLIKYIVNVSKRGNKLLIIDHMDFLIHVWGETQFKELITFIEMSENSFCCLFIMQDYRLISKLTLNNEKGNRRNINIFDIGQGGIINV